MEKILIMGDIHGSWTSIRDLYKRHPYTFNNQANVLILLGDSGLNYFFNHRDIELKKKLGKYPFTFFVIRGNHEERPSICAENNPDKWHLDSFWGNLVWVENDYPYIKYAMDYVNVYDIPYELNNSKDNNINFALTYKTLIVPGAYSVDKYKRLQMGWSWFPMEQLTEKEREDGLALCEECGWKFDLVLSHTCPIIYEPTDLFLPTIDQSMVDKTMERYLGDIEFNLDYKLWCFGHFHDTRVYPRNEDKQILMLFNNKVIELSEWVDGSIGQWY